jgi:hypothetical protein
MSDEAKSLEWHGLPPTVEFTYEVPPWDGKITLELIQRAFAESMLITGAAPLPPQDSKQGARSVAAHDRMVDSIYQRALTSGTRAIEPTSIDKASPAQKFGLDMPSARPEEWDEPLRPSPLMRRLGYTAHPDACTHHRKRLMLGSTEWHCKDCGVAL